MRLGKPPAVASAHPRSASGSLTDALHRSRLPTSPGNKRTRSLWVFITAPWYNPKDTADHPEGVWTLPPTLRLKDKDRDYYLDIGESDRMTLKFIKPEG